MAEGDRFNRVHVLFYQGDALAGPFCNDCFWPDPKGKGRGDYVCVQILETGKEIG